MTGRITKTVIATVVTASLMTPYVIYAADITEDTASVAADEVFGTNNAVVTENLGLIQTNTGTVTDNKGKDLNKEDRGLDHGIIVNNGTVTTNNGDIYTNVGSVGINNGTIHDVTTTKQNPNATPSVETNNGTIDYVNNGTVDTNNEGKKIGYVNVNSTVTTNNGIIEKVDGKVVTNNGTIDEVTTQPTQPGNVKGTVETNEGTIGRNAAIVEDNNGTIRVNESKGVVKDNTDGIVKINEGGVVNGGTVEINLGHPENAMAANVLQQMYQVISEKLGNLSWTDATDNGKNDYYETYSYGSQVELWLDTKGKLILTPADPTKEIKSISTPNGGATVVKREDGKYEIYGITKDTNLSVLFVGESVPVKVEVKAEEKKDDDKKEEKKTESAPSVVSTPAVATLTASSPVPVAPSAKVMTLAPVINPSALYGAVDLNGVPTNATVVSSENNAMRSSSTNLITSALATSGIVREEIYTGFTGKITTQSQGSIMTLNNVVVTYNYKYDTDIYVAFKNPATGAMMYVLPKINSDGSISFEVPFANCEFSVVYAEKVSRQEQDKKEQAGKKQVGKKRANKKKR